MTALAAVSPLPPPPVFGSFHTISGTGTFAFLPQGFMNGLASGPSWITLLGSPITFTLTSVGEVVRPAGFFDFAIHVAGTVIDGSTGLTSPFRGDIAGFDVHLPPGATPGICVWDAVLDAFSGGLSAPTNLKASQVSPTADSPQVPPTKVVLSWDYGNDAVEGFSIERKTISQTWDQATTVTTSLAAACIASTSTPPQKTCFYIDNDNALRATFATFLYRVRAYQGSVFSDYSNIDAAYQLQKQTLFSKSAINAIFNPDPTLPSASAAAKKLGTETGGLPYDHFNWISEIEHEPQCYINAKDTDQQHAWKRDVPGFPVPGDLRFRGAALFAPRLDPEPGGYFEYGLYKTNNIIQYCRADDGNSEPCLGPSDSLPFYWDEVPQWDLYPSNYLNPHGGINGDIAGGPQDIIKTVMFYDRPKDPCLPGSTPSQAGEYFGFLTTLVAVRTPIGAQQPDYTPLVAFAWNTTYNGKTGGITTLNVIPPSPPVIDGTGGVFNVASVNIVDLPLDARQLLIAAGAKGVPTSPKVDKDAPMTVAFLSGPQGTNGWYTGPVTVTLIATDIDGPSDIAVTSYRLDGGPATNYTGPFTVPGDGTHTVVFGSVDRALNAETPLPSQAFKIDATPPTVNCTANPNTLWPPNGKPVLVTVSGTITDALWGVFPNGEWNQRA